MLKYVWQNIILYADAVNSKVLNPCIMHTSRMIYAYLVKQRFV